MFGSALDGNSHELTHFYNAFNHKVTLQYYFNFRTCTGGRDMSSLCHLTGLLSLSALGVVDETVSPTSLPVSPSNQPNSSHYVAVPTTQQHQQRRQSSVLSTSHTMHKLPSYQEVDPNPPPCFAHTLATAGIRNNSSTVVCSCSSDNTRRVSSSLLPPSARTPAYTYTALSGQVRTLSPTTSSHGYMPRGTVPVYSARPTTTPRHTTCVPTCVPLPERSQESRVFYAVNLPQRMRGSAMSLSPPADETGAPPPYEAALMDDLMV